MTTLEDVKEAITNFVNDNEHEHVHEFVTKLEEIINYTTGLKAIAEQDYGK